MSMTEREYLTKDGPVPMKCATASAGPSLAPEGFERLLTPEEVAEILSVQKSWVYQAARNGTLPSIRVGRWVRFRSKVVEEFIAKGGAGE